jgi:hypothetical protein
VQFVVDGSNFGSPVALSAGQATSGATSILAVGDHTVVANFQGSTNFQSSSGSIGGGGQTVNQANTTATITNITPTVVQAGNPITVSFSVLAVAPGAGTPTGNVTVSYAEGTETCTATVAVGNCSLTPTTGVPGVITVTATYAGDTSFNGDASDPVSHTFNP